MFVFRNRAGHMLKILWWDQDGLAIYYKRLEHGVFRFPVSGQRSLAIDRTALMRLLRGLELVQQRVA
jgi:transposase